MHCYLMKTGKTLLTKENYQYHKNYIDEISQLLLPVTSGPETGKKNKTSLYSNTKIMCSLHP